MNIDKLFDCVRHHHYGFVRYWMLLKLVPEENSVLP